MGPKSKQAICDVLGHILDEQQQQRSTIEHEVSQIRHMLQSFLESESAELTRVKARVTQLERKFGRFPGGTTPAPA